MARKATPSCIDSELKPPTKLSNVPINKAATTAPGIWPNPPTMTIAKDLKRIGIPITGCTVKTGAKAAPASPAKATPKTTA